MEFIESRAVFVRDGSDTLELVPPWFVLVWGAHASRVLLSASRRERFGGLGRDALADTRDACAPRTGAISFCHVPELASGILTLGAVLQPAFNIFDARAEAPRHFQSLAPENQ